MGMTICPVTEAFAAEVGDVDLSKPLTAADFAAIEAAFWKYSVLVFPDQGLTPDQHMAFAQRFGPIETDRVLEQDAVLRRVPKGFADISNLDDEAGIWGKVSRKRIYAAGNRIWHTDSS